MSIVNIGDVESFKYTGTVQEFIVPINGIYKFIVTGSKSGGNRYGYGGQSIGYANLKKGTTLYICVGGKGGESQASGTINKGGYNGGGNGYALGGIFGTGGGGATHIATITGTLKQIGIDNIDKILIVAGGGGGRFYSNDVNSGGGHGGGLSGGRGESSGGTGGTQSGGYAFGQGGSIGSSGNAGAGGGGGLYGGKGAYLLGGGGGSGYIGGVPEFIYKNVTYTPSTTAGKNTKSTGSASITLMEKTSDITAYIGDIAVKTMCFGDLSVDIVI